MTSWVRGDLPTLIALCALSFVTGCGPEPENTARMTSNDLALGTKAESSFGVSYRIYRTRSGTVRRFDDLIPTSWFKDIERRDEEDYHLDLFASGSTSPPGIGLSLLKWPTRNEDDVYLEMNFRIPSMYLETGKSFECPFNGRNDPSNCNVSGEITSLGRRERLFLPSSIKSPPLLCRFKVSESTLNLNSEILAGKSVRLPAKAGSLEAIEKLAFSFQCEDVKHRLVALRGHFLQNTRKPASVSL